MLTGRSWSGAAPVRRVEVSTDGGHRWHRALLRDTPARNRWVRWSFPHLPRHRGPAELLARATDTTGRTQPPNTQGYLFDAVVRHRVQIV
ncbi:hypothetical protein ACFQVA_33790 [Actinomadura keratinilytica]